MKEQPNKSMVHHPPYMRDLIAESARHYRRSMNSDIVARLQHSFRGLSDESKELELAPSLHEKFESLFRPTFRRKKSNSSAAIAVSRKTNATLY